MKKMIKVSASLLILGFLGFCLISCNKNSGTLPSPVPPKELIGEWTKKNDDSFYFADFPWYMQREDVMKRMETYTLLLEDDTQSIYLSNGAWEDTPYIQWVSFYFSDGNELAGIAVSFYLEENKEKKGKELEDLLTTDLRSFIGEDETKIESWDNFIRYKKSSGSEIGCAYYENVGEAAGVDWENFDEVRVFFSFPEDRVSSILQERESLLVE